MSDTNFVFLKKLSLKLSCLSLLQSFASKSVIKELNSANILYSTSRDPFYEPYLTHPRYGVSGFNIYNRLVDNWFKGDKKSADWFLSWIFYRTIAKRLFKKIVHFSVILVSSLLLLNYVFFANANIFLKIGAGVFGSLIILIYYGLTSTPTRIFRESIKNFDNGIFDYKSKKIFFENFFLDLPASCYSLEDFIRLSSITDKNSIEALEVLHSEWLDKSSDLINCVAALEKV